MLVLSRKINQEIKLNDNITITINRIKGETVRIGIDAPKEVKIVRGELETLSEEKASQRKAA